MNNDNLDILISQSLKASAPKGLEEKILEKANKREKLKKRRIKYMRIAASAAAMFICAVAVLHNTNLLQSPRLQNEKAADSTAPKEKPTPKTAAKKEEIPEKGSAAADTAQNTAPKKVYENTPNPARSKKQKNTVVSPEDADAVPSEDAYFPAAESEEDNAAPAQAEAESENLQTAAHDAVSDLPPETAVSAFSAPSGGARAMKSAPLSSLFLEDFDYKTEIYKNILPQLENIEGCTVTQITGDERYLCDEDGTLTIIFPPGEGAPSAAGELRLYAGIIKDGILAE